MVPVRTAQKVKDELTRRVIERFEDAGMTIAWTESVRVHSGDPDAGA